MNTWPQGAYSFLSRLKLPVSISYKIDGYVNNNSPPAGHQYFELFYQPPPMSLAQQWQHIAQIFREGLKVNNLVLSNHCYNFLKSPKEPIVICQVLFNNISSVEKYTSQYGSNGCYDYILRQPNPVYPVHALQIELIGNTKDIKLFNNHSRRVYPSVDINDLV